jgi:acetyltransferase-like isoleucine patch superfamily enzyme
MNSGPQYDTAEARRCFARFLAGQTDERVFVRPTGHPSSPTSLCYCDGSLWRAAAFYFRAGVLHVVLKQPSDRLKSWWLRRLGARVGQNVHFSYGVWIDPMFPQLLTLEDDVFLGIEARIALHEFRIDEFRAGRVAIRRGALIGGWGVIGCGVEIGERATVGAGAVVRRDVPASATAIGNPARIVRTVGREPEETDGR